LQENSLKAECNSARGSGHNEALVALALLSGGAVFCEMRSHSQTIQAQDGFMVGGQGPESVG
jgi:hypothetical protein